MPMVTKFALLSLFSNTEDSSSCNKGLSSFRTRRSSCKPEGGVRRMSSISSESSIASTSTASSSECSSCPNFVNCGGDPNYKNNKINNDTNDENSNRLQNEKRLQNGKETTTMMPSLSWQRATRDMTHCRSVEEHLYFVFYISFVIINQ